MAQKLYFVVQNLTFFQYKKTQIDDSKNTQQGIKSRITNFCCLFINGFSTYIFRNSNAIIDTPTKLLFFIFQRFVLTLSPPVMYSRIKIRIALQVVFISLLLFHKRIPKYILRNNIIQVK